MRLSVALLGIVACAALSSAIDVCANTSAVPAAALPSGFCAFYYATSLTSPRGILVMPNNDVLVVEQDLSKVTVLYDGDGDGVSDMSERATLAAAPGLNHAIAVQGSYLYASSATTVYRWKYQPGQRSNLGEGEVVITNMPAGGHSTRSLAFDEAGYLYVQVGSGSNVDRNSDRARIVRFPPLQNIPAGGIDWKKGEVFADGLRNEVGLRFNKDGVMWGVENGVDDLFRPDLGGDIHNTNPSEEINIFREPGKFYGYPYCWSEYAFAKNESHPRGTQWVHPNFMMDGIHSDKWCQDSENVVPPAFSMDPHTAPLDVLFWDSTSFPAEYSGSAFVSLHGSWNRQPPAGYRVDFIKIVNGNPVSSQPFFRYEGPGDKGSNWPHRPVGLAVHKCSYGECLLITSDASNAIISVAYQHSSQQ